MRKWAGRAAIAAILMGGGYVAYDTYRSGVLSRPDMPEGAFSLSFKNGLRAILVGVPNETTSRRYLGYAAEVPFYLEDAWSFCRSPRENEQQRVSGFMKRRDWPGERFEAVCEIEVDATTVVRGWITSVPRV